MLLLGISLIPPGHSSPDLLQADIFAIAEHLAHDTTVFVVLVPIDNGFLAKAQLGKMFFTCLPVRLFLLWRINSAESDFIAGVVSF